MMNVRKLTKCDVYLAACASLWSTTRKTTWFQEHRGT